MAGAPFASPVLRRTGSPGLDSCHHRRLDKLRLHRASEGDCSAGYRSSRSERDRLWQLASGVRVRDGSFASLCKLPAAPSARPAGSKADEDHRPSMGLAVHGQHSRTRCFPFRKEKSDQTWVRQPYSSYRGWGRGPRGSQKASTEASKGRLERREQGQGEGDRQVTCARAPTSQHMAAYSWRLFKCQRFAARAPCCQAAGASLSWKPALRQCLTFSSRPRDAFLSEAGAWAPTLAASFEFSFAAACSLHAQTGSAFFPVV